MSKARTNNYYEFVMDGSEVESVVAPSVLKVKMRKAYIGDGEVSVLDTFFGAGELWGRVKKGRKARINVLGISEKPAGLNLVGNNVKYVKSLDLRNYDIVDVDAPSSPYAVLKALFMNNSFNKMGVFFTLNKILSGGLDRKMLLDLGFTSGMLKTARPMLQEKAFELFKGWLGRMGVRTLKYYALKYSWGRVYLGFFKISRQKT